MPGGKGSFRLWKYYLDCVGADGTVCIGYAGGLRWGPLAVHYAALLEGAPDGGRRERHSYRETPEPRVESGGVHWECAPLGVSGSWRDAVPGYRATLLESAAGTVRWQVLAPKAEARVERAGGGVVTGWGYVERLELNLEPWRLPLNTLYWGRFHSPTDALVWIGWEGDVRLRHITHNDRLLADAHFGEQVLRFDPGLELQLLDTRTIRDAPVIAALDRLPRALRRVPPSFATAREVKWLSRARLSSGQGPPAMGWALHERVRFR
ncbi:MAG: hypothetical protein FIB01_01555 [Gemmatimonadetes bacterium]|nr:hypothetical protein [Gemmatimonadota bacterium]